MSTVANILTGIVIAAQSAPVVREVWSMDGCAPCAALESRLAGYGVQIEHEAARTYPAWVTAFPAVKYSDNKVDNGQRIGGKKSVRIPVKLIVHKYDGGK